MKRSPPAVTIGPPRLGEPHSAGTFAACPGSSGRVNEPSGTSHKRRPVFRSMATSGPNGVGRAPYVVRRQTVRAERRNHRGEWLRGGRLLSRDVTRGDGTLLHRKDRPPRLALEDEQHAGFGGL